MLKDKLFYQKEYFDKERSIHDIAKEEKTYPNKILRELKAYGFQPRNRSEAQKIALKSGRHQHPTKGKPRPQDVKLKISNAFLQRYRNAKT